MLTPRTGASAKRQPQAIVNMRKQLVASGFALVKRVPSKLPETPHILILRESKSGERHMAGQYPNGLFTSPIPVTTRRLREIQERGG